MATKKQSLKKQITQQVWDSHTRLLDQALDQKPEVTDFATLQKMYPDYDNAKLLRLQKLNQKINQANDFLIEEQSAWLDPSSRPEGGIFYDEMLFGVPFATDEEDQELIQSEVYDEEN